MRARPKCAPQRGSAPLVTPVVLARVMLATSSDYAEEHPADVGIRVTR
jgi:hypothetical protein